MLTGKSSHFCKPRRPSGRELGRLGLGGGGITETPGAPDRSDGYLCVKGGSLWRQGLEDVFWLLFYLKDKGFIFA